MSFRGFLILSHRWLGIPMSVVFIVWFVSGIVMMYAGGMPQLTDPQRIERAQPLDLDAVRLSPMEAAERGFVFLEDPGPTVLRMVDGRPAYRFGRGPWAATIFADNGETLEPLDVERSQSVAARFLGAPAERIEFERTVTEPDQWTLVQARDLPLHKFRADDGSGTELYVSPERAEVVLATTRMTRAAAWLGTIPHWFYFTPLRVNQPVWYWSVVVASALGCVLAVLGLVLGVVQFRPSRPFRLSTSIRYRGWMRWHYLLGAVFGIFTLTWVFSGLLSMEPFEWTRAQGFTFRQDVLTGGPIELARYAPAERSDWAALLDGRALKEIELLRIKDEPYYLARYTRSSSSDSAKRERLHQPYPVSGRNEAGQLLVSAESLAARESPFSTGEIVSRLKAALPPEFHIVEHELLEDYDSYYYSRGRQAPLPVLRVKLDDPLETWVYVDPQLARIVAQIHRLNRVERWLFNGLHSLDFAFWYDKRPLWDLGLIVLSIGAIVMSAIGLVFGVRRIGRKLRRAAKPFAAGRSVG